MKSNKSSIGHIQIDGQEILLPTQEDWENILVEPIIDGRPVAIVYSIERVLRVANRCPDIYLGLGFLSLFMEWMPYVFVKIEDHFQRVHLEKLTCETCHWTGMTANPMVIDSYFGDGINQDYFILMKYAMQYPILKCPQCGDCLPRHPIWIEV
jgi:hypothetical protein